MEIPKVFKFPHDLQQIGDGWVVQNLIEYGNSALPTCLLELLDRKTIERLLTAIIDESVTVRKSQYGYIAERVI